MKSLSKEGPIALEKRVPKVRARLAASVSGYVQVRKFSAQDRAAIAVLIERGEAELFDSPVGRAYRLKAKEATT